ncbi:MAG: DUF4339 domain-containing protein [Bacteriovoracaceae bacterium]|nr:DUF4339 domain-containing protein [Bacteriovoracaceae bacterium]
MEQKVYWCLNEGNYLGPLSYEQIEQLIQEKMIDGRTPLRRDKFNKWNPLNHYPEFVLPSDAHPLNLPSLPSDLQKKQDVQAVVIPFTLKEPVVAKMPPPVVVKKDWDIREEDVFLDQVPLKKVELPEPKIEQEKEAVEVSPAVKPHQTSRHQIPLLLFFILLLSALLYQKSQEKFKSFSGMRLNDYEKLLQTTQIPLEKGVNFSYGFSKDQKTLWLTSNLPIKAKVWLVLESIYGKTIQFEDVTIQTTGHYENHRAEFKNFTFTRGTKFIPGFYQVKLYAQKIPSQGFEGVIEKLFGQQQKTMNLYEHKGEVLYTTNSPDIFLQKLQKLISLREKLEKKYLDEINIKYQTLSVFAKNLTDLQLKTLQIKGRKKATRYFEKNYRNEFSPFLTSFIKENENLILEMGKRFPIITTEFQILSEQVTKMANFSAFFLNELSRKVPLPDLHLLIENEMNPILQKLSQNPLEPLKEKNP